MERLSQLEDAAALLAADPNFRVLRRLPCGLSERGTAPPDAIVGVIVDVETTGLDVEIDDVIELGMIKFAFDRSGLVGPRLDVYQSLNEPSAPIPAEIVALTGITQADVQGRKIEPREIKDFLRGVSLVIAHNAAFDRPFCERLFSGFSELAWGCSATEIDWRAEGVSGSRLEYVVASFGYFYEAHRAIDDCNAVHNILGLPLAKTGVPVLARLLEAARRSDVRVFADGAPYSSRIALKRRGYRWNDGLNGYPRAWWKDVPTVDLDEELSALEVEIGPGLEPTLVRMTAKNRFRKAA
ncbi:3'-5' exonuclease [Caulobacter segnis]